LVYFHGIDKPVRVEKCSGIIGNIILARIRHTRAAPFTPRTPGPLPTKRRIEHNVVISETVFEITSRPRERRHWCTPRFNIRLRVCNIVWNICALPEPDINAAGGPLHSIDAAVYSVEPCSIRIRICGADSASRVAGAGVAIGVVCGCASERVGVVHRAAWRGVESDGVGVCAVDSFDDVDFAGGGPVGTEHPEGGPGAADAAGHVLDVCYEDTLGWEKLV
jgi:hypothetical protein